MKKSDIEKRLKNEISTSAPSDFDDVMKRCGISDESLSVEDRAIVGGGTAETVSRRKRLRIVAVLTAFILAVGVAIGFILKGVFGKKDEFGLSVSDGYFIFDINPSVEVSYDGKGIVKDAKGLNEDGDVLLHGLQLSGKTCEETAEILVERCVQLGYFSVGRTDNAVLISATKEEGGEDAEMLAIAKSYFVSEFSEKKMCGVVITGVNDEKLNEEAQSYGIDAQKYALIQEYIGLGGTLDESAYGDVSIRELYALIRERTEEKKQTGISELQTMVETQLYEAVSEVLEEIVEGLQACIDELGLGDDGEQRRHYEECLDRLEEKAERLEDAKNQGEFEKFSREVLEELKNLNEREHDRTLKELFEKAQGQIEEVFLSVEGWMEQLSELREGVEDKNNQRLDKFGNGETDSLPDEDIENWQEQYETQYEQDWFRIKNQWKQDRNTELKD